MSWACGACTVVNEKALYLCCGVCGTTRAGAPGAAASSSAALAPPEVVGEPETPSPPAKRRRSGASGGSPQGAAASPLATFFMRPAEKAVARAMELEAKRAAIRRAGGGAIFTAGLRRDAAEDRSGQRPVAWARWQAMLREHHITKVCDLRSGRGKQKCGEGRHECGISHPKWACACSIERLHAAACVAYEWLGNQNLGGGAVCIGSDRVVPNGAVRRAMLDPSNTVGRPFDLELKAAGEGRRAVVVAYDAAADGALMRVAESAASGDERVLLFCVEDEICSCHRYDLVVLLCDRGHEVTNLEPPPTPGAPPGTCLVPEPRGRRLGPGEGRAWRARLEGLRDLRDPERAARRESID